MIWGHIENNSVSAKNQMFIKSPERDKIMTSSFWNSIVNIFVTLQLHIKLIICLHWAFLSTCPDSHRSNCFRDTSQQRSQRNADFHYCSFITPSGKTRTYWKGHSLKKGERNISRKWTTVTGLGTKWQLGTETKPGQSQGDKRLC